MPGSVPAKVPAMVTINEPSNVPLGTENSISLFGTLGESVVPDESTPDGLVVGVVLTGAVSTGASVPDASGSVDGTPDGAVDGTPDGSVDGTPDGAVGGTPDGAVDGTPDGAVGAAVSVDVLDESPALGVTEGTALGPGSLPSGFGDWEEQPADRASPATESNSADGRIGFIQGSGGGRGATLRAITR